MVNLPIEDQFARPLFERRQCNTLIHHMCHGPVKLLDVEGLAEAAANYTSISFIRTRTNHKQFAINHLRRIFNLEFQMRCHLCGTAHFQDEISAPER